MTTTADNNNKNIDSNTAAVRKAFGIERDDALRYRVFWHIDAEKERRRHAYAVGALVARVEVSAARGNLLFYTDKCTDADHVVSLRNAEACAERYFSDRCEGRPVQPLAEFISKSLHPSYAALPNLDNLRLGEDFDETVPVAAEHRTFGSNFADFLGIVMPLEIGRHLKPATSMNIVCERGLFADFYATKITMYFYVDKPAWLLSPEERHRNTIADCAAETCD